MKPQDINDKQSVQIYWLNTKDEQVEFVDKVDCDGLYDLVNWYKSNCDAINDKKKDSNYVLIFATEYSKYYNKQLEIN